MCHIINSCIAKSTFPPQWKTTRTIPKINNPKSSDNYRPVSILPVLSKIIERVDMKQIISFIDKEQLCMKYYVGTEKDIPQLQHCLE